MSGKLNYIDQVGAFLDNELSGEDLANFNQELARNPELAKELSFQKELIEGIKDYRHTQLKARLDNIPVGTGVWSGTAIKIISGALITAGVGFGIYQLIQKPDPVAPKEEISITINDDQPEKVNDQEMESPEEIIKDPLTEEIREEKTEQPEAKRKEKSVAVPTAPKVINPESFDTDHPMEDDLEIPESALGSDSEPLESQLEIEIISNKRKYPFHYQVNNGRLFLYGNFDEEPYELLEISINNEKKLYLFFKEKYYEIEKDMDEITPLQVVTNKSLILELEKLKNKDS